MLAKNTQKDQTLFVWLGLGIVSVCHICGTEVVVQLSPRQLTNKYSSTPVTISIQFRRMCGKNEKLIIANADNGSRLNQLSCIVCCIVYHYERAKHSFLYAALHCTFF